MQFPVKYIVAGVIVLALLGGGAYYFFSRSSSGTTPSLFGQGKTDTDWCQSPELAAVLTKTSEGAPQPSPSQENVAGMVRATTSYAQTYASDALKKGVRTTASEYCALQIATVNMGPTQHTVLSGSTPENLAALGKYIGSNRAQVVLDYNAQLIGSTTTETADVNVKALMANTKAALLNCIQDKENRIAEPVSNEVLCQRGGVGAPILSRWLSIENFGGKWGSCPFQVMRDADGKITDVHYCATLPSGKQITCTLQGCF